MKSFVSEWEPTTYQLVDFGGERKLERFGQVLLDRPCPAATGARQNPRLWTPAIRVGVGGSRTEVADWPIHVDGMDMSMRLKITPYGHVGMFPEQLSNWKWLQGVVQSLAATQNQLSCLNLFGYTGGSTLALAAAGQALEVRVNSVHVDASQPSVKWARENATASGLEGAPVRWIVDDAVKFVEREVRRERTYQVIVLDPPTFGHGPSGRRWDMRSDLSRLVEGCCQLLDPSGGFVLLTGHSSEPSDQECAGLLKQQAIASGHVIHSMVQGRAGLPSSDGRLLDTGFVVRMHVQRD